MTLWFYPILQTLLKQCVQALNNSRKLWDSIPGITDGWPRISKLGTSFSAAIQGGTTPHSNTTSSDKNIRK